MNHYGTLRDYRFADKDADDIRGTNIYGLNDEKLGDIDDVVFDHSTGDIRYVVVDSGGWLSSKKFLVPADRLRPSTMHKDDYHADLTKAQIEQFPPYNEKDIDDADRWRQYDDRYQKQMTTGGGVMHRTDSSDRIITPPASEGLPSGAASRSSAPITSAPVTSEGVASRFDETSGRDLSVNPNSSATGAVNMGPGTLSRPHLGQRWTNFEDSIRRDRPRIASSCNVCKFTPESAESVNRDRPRKIS
ncbi:MAG TPA: PRC-barrel domain-containing protein [Terriglobales bacterium]|nr:PRC-barrel domain-containing protein [Terriglobales bacterium]